MALDLCAYHQKRIEIRGSQVSTIRPELRGRWTTARRIEVTIELLQVIRPSRMISHRFSLDDASEAFELLDSGNESLLQIVLEPAGAQ